MPKPKQALDALKAAKEAYKAKFTPGFYHASGASDIKEFIPSHRGAIFATRDPEFAGSFHPIDEAASVELPSGFAYARGATTYPLSINMGKHFDVETPEGKKFVEEFLKKQPSYFPHKLENFLGDQSWASVENPEFSRALKKAGYDTFSIKEGGVKNIGVFNPKNIRGKFAEYNPEHAESADFMKAEGGKINPIKTPREMLLELVEVPRMMAGGRMPPQLQDMVNSAIKRYVQKYKKMPPAEDIKALRAHAQSLTQKPTIWTDPVTQARARHQLATDPNLIDPETARDPFLTKAMTGRTVKGTYLEPKPMDINDPNVVKAIEAEQAAGALDVPPTTTPGASALAETATALENRELSQGATPLIDKLKAKFFKENKRYPTEEEMDALVAGYNPLRHQYGSIGENILTSRPPTAKGLSQWKEKARTEGVPESYLEKSPADYRKPQRDILSIGRGEQPTTPVTAEDAIRNPDREYADGRSVAALTPREMQAMMIAQGKTPSKFAPEGRMEKLTRGLSVPFAGMSAMAAGERLAAGDPYEAGLYGASAVGNALGATRKYMKPGLGIAGGASVPLSVDEAIRRYKMGDRTGAVIAALEAAGNAAAMFPPTAVPGSLIGFGAGVANAIRGEPEYTSVMEGYK